MFLSTWIHHPPPNLPKTTKVTHFSKRNRIIIRYIFWFDPIVRCCRTTHLFEYNAANRVRFVWRVFVCRVCVCVAECYGSVAIITLPYIVVLLVAGVKITSSPFGIHLYVVHIIEITLHTPRHNPSVAP